MPSWNVGYDLFSTAFIGLKRTVSLKNYCLGEPLFPISFSSLLTFGNFEGF